MNSIEEKKKTTAHEKQFDKRLQITKNMIEQINKGIEVKQYMGEKSFCHHTNTKNFYLDELMKYYEGKGFTVKLVPTEDIYSYNINVSW